MTNLDIQEALTFLRQDRNDFAHWLQEQETNGLDCIDPSWVDLLVSGIVDLRLTIKPSPHESDLQRRITIFCDTLLVSASIMFPVSSPSGGPADPSAE